MPSISNLAKNLSQAVVSPFRAVRAEGGIGPSFRLLVQVIRTEGLAGTRRRIIGLVSTNFRNDYQTWVERYDTLTDEDREQLRQRYAALPEQPLISIVMPTYNSRLDWLEQAVQSVLRQIYEHWELCIADDASTDPEIRRYLEQLPQRDDRIKVALREENGHISAASNTALELCTGEFVALMDHDDLLTEHALFYVVDTINQYPQAELIYSDEDKISLDGRRVEPYFKCDFNPELFYSHNQITHLGVYRRSRVEAIGGFRVGYEGSQDWDLALRFIEGLDHARIRHIPRVLYHWRKHEGSTSHSINAKHYAVDAGRRAINDHFQRSGVDAEVEWTDFGFRTRYGMPEPAPKVSLIIPTRNKADLLRTCIRSIRENTRWPHYEILVVDNGSDDPETLDFLEAEQAAGHIRVLRDERPFNFSALNNRAVEHATGELIALVNNDIEITEPGWLTELALLALQDGIGAVGAKLTYPNKRVQHAGIILGVGGVADHAFRNLPAGSSGYYSRAQLTNAWSAVTAACLVVRRSLYQQVGGLDEEKLGIAYNDVDFCIRLREAGYRNLMCPFVKIIHHESVSRGLEDTPEKRGRLARETAALRERWGELLDNDPMYSPNLSDEFPDFSYAWPPRLPGQDIRDSQGSQP